MNSSDQKGQLSPSLALLMGIFPHMFPGTKCRSPASGGSSRQLSMHKHDHTYRPKGGAELKGREINPHHAVSYKEHEPGRTAGTGSSPTSPLIYSVRSLVHQSMENTLICYVLWDLLMAEAMPVRHCCHNPNPRELLQLVIFRAARPVNKDLSVYVSGTMATLSLCVEMHLQLSSSQVLPNKQHQTGSIPRKLGGLHLKLRAKLDAKCPTLKDKTNWAPNFPEKSWSKKSHFT